jgi:hypothetical protein
MRAQVGRQRKEILQLQRAGISTASAGLLLQRTRTKIDAFVTSGTGSRRRRAVPREGARAWRPELVTAEPLKWSDEGADNSPWIKALAELRHRATREGWCYQHVQAISVAIDQYAEKAMCNREYFLNKPYSIGGGRKDHVP